MRAAIDMAYEHDGDDVTTLTTLDDTTQYATVGIAQMFYEAMCGVQHQLHTKATVVSFIETVLTHIPLLQIFSALFDTVCDEHYVDNHVALNVFIAVATLMATGMQRQTTKHLTDALAVSSRCKCTLQSVSFRHNWSLHPTKQT